MKKLNPNAGSKTVEELREIIGYAKMPFILKGIMTPKGAAKAIEADAAGIVVSNHGGRVLGQCPGTAEVLPEVVKAVNGRITIFVDGGIRSGVDVFKALAMGADAVLIGRPFVPMVYGGEAIAVKIYIEKIAAELRDTMTMCGAHSLNEITPDMARLPDTPHCTDVSIEELFGEFHLVEKRAPRMSMARAICIAVVRSPRNREESM